MKHRLVTGPRDLVPLALAFALPVTALVAHAGVLAALPLLAVVLPLLFGRYPGARTLTRLAARRRRYRPARELGAAPRCGIAALTPRRGRLIAHSLAKRPPPAPLPSAS